MKQSLRRVKANLIARSQTQNLNMSDSENKRALVALKGHFTRLTKNFDDHLKDFSVDKTELSLKSLQTYLERLQSYEVKVSEKGEELAMSDDEQTRLYGEKELDDIAEKLSDAQKRFNEVTRTSKTEKGAGLLFSMRRDDQNVEDDIGDVRPIFNRDEGTRGKKDDPIPIWRPRVTFEAWKLNLKHWMEEVKYSEHQYLTRMTSMLQGNDVAEGVKEFAIKLGERRQESRDTVDKILDALQEKFGETEEEKYRRKLENF